MVEILGYRVKHPWFAVFFWSGTLSIAAGAVTNPYWSNGAIPAFMAVYGLSFLFFGATVYAALFVINWYSLRDRRDVENPTG